MSTTVLVVEDDLEINELIGEYLALENIRYLPATTGQAGIHLATQHPDAIILDLMLPDIDGFEVARALSARRATFDIPIIILSCMCQECDRQKGFASGALFFMNKPFLPDDLLATLRQALDWKQSLKTRAPVGDIMLGGKEGVPCRKSVNQMIADLYARTQLSDGAVSDIHAAVDTLDAWAGQWAATHPKASQLKLNYRITPIPAVAVNGNAAPLIEWKLTEETPGLLADAFFKTAPAPTGGLIGGGLIGWGASTLMSKPLAPIAPPAQWLEILAKTGAGSFEKDSRFQSVRFYRLGIENGKLSTTGVPVFEIDGKRAGVRAGDGTLTAK